MQVAEDVQGNEKLSLYFNELESFFERLLYQPGYVTSQRAYRKASALYDDGQSLLAENDQWKQDAGKLQKELEALVNGITNDKATQRLVTSLENLGSSLASAGQIGFGALRAEGQGLYRDFADVLVPRLISLVKEIPVPRVEYKSEDVDIVIDDIKLESASFIPDSIRIVQNNDLRFTQGYATCKSWSQPLGSRLTKDASEYDASLRLRVSGVHFAASNIAFWLSKKTGFMPYEDAGLLDLTFGHKGISFDVTLENANEDDQETFFTVKGVAVSISDFDFKVRENDQWLATWFAKPVLKAFVKVSASQAISLAQPADFSATSRTLSKHRSPSTCESPISGLTAFNSESSLLRTRSLPRPTSSTRSCETRFSLSPTTTDRSRFDRPVSSSTVEGESTSCTLESTRR